VIASIKLAKYLNLGSDDAILTVATDGAEMYGTELQKTLANRSDRPFDSLDAAETFGRFLHGALTDHTLELDTRNRERIFNLGYYTWVEQQGISVEQFDVRRQQSFWDNLMNMVPVWDAMIAKFNAAS
jgi:cysteine synthase A